MVDTPPVATPPKNRPQASAPSQTSLISRIFKLQHEAELGIKAGQTMSPATRSSLERIKRKADDASSIEDRRKVAQDLDAWEKLFLHRK